MNHEPRRIYELLEYFVSGIDNMEGSAIFKTPSSKTTPHHSIHMFVDFILVSLAISTQIFVYF